MKMKPPNPEQILTVRNTDGEIVQIDQLHVNMARKTLGAYQTATGTKIAEVEYLLGKIKNLERKYTEKQPES